MYNSGGLGLIITGETDLIHALQTLKRQVERGIFSTNVSTFLIKDVPSIITSDELAQIQQYLSSVLATSVENTPLFEALLSLQGLSSISEYNILFSKAAQGIADSESTMTGLEGEIHAEVDKLPLAVLNVTNRQIDYDSAKFTYSTSVDSFSTISSYYHSSQVAYMNSIQDYINASTLEYTSTATLIREYNMLYTAYWSSIVSEYGLHWYIYDPSQAGGGNSQSLLNILTSYSSVQLPSFILEDIAGIDLHSTAIRTLDGQIAEYKHEMSSHILTDYSTLVSTYTQNIMEYQNEILSLTLGDIHREASTMIGLSTQYICSIQYDISTATGAAIAQSTYNYYDRLLRELSTNIGYWSSVYTTSLESFSSIERQCSSIRQMVHFLQLEEAEVGAMAKYNSTGLLKSALEDMISQIGQGVNIDDYFNSIQATFAGLQSGGASLADVQTMYSTVNILYSRYSAQLSTATYNRSMVPPTLDDIASNDLSTSIAINNAYIAERQAIYDKNILSSNTITRLLSSQMQYLASYISTSTISDSYLSSIYDAEYAQYQSMIQRLLQEEYSTQQAIYKYSNASMMDSILLANAYNTELRIIQRLEELGYVIDSAQSGGGVYESISSQQLSLGSGGLIGAARNAVCTQQAGVDAIVKSIDDITNAMTNIKTASMVTVNAAVQKLNTDSAIWLGYADSNYARQSTTSEYKMLNYLYTLYTFSTMLTTDLLENRDEITSINYNIWKGVPNTVYSGIGVTPSTSTQTATTDYIALRNGLSTSSVQIRNFRPILQSFINVISAEDSSNQYYLACKNIYEKQSYYRVYQGGSFPDKMSNYDFERLKTTYDLSIQNVNRYTTYRRNMYQPFLNSVNALIPSLRKDIYYDLTHSISSILPLPVSLRMEGNFDLKPPRAVFIESGIPTTTLLDCPPSTIRVNQSAVQHIPYASTPTTTLNATVYGVQGRYVSISRGDGNYEIMQVLVIDSTGKNVAFGKSVLTSVPIASSTSFIVNGQYSDDVPANFTPYFKSPASESPNLNKFIIIDLGKTYDITSIQYVKSNKSTYDSRGLLITVFDSNQIPQAGGELKANTSIEYINFRKDGSVKSIGVNPSRTGVCGYMGRYVCLSKSSGTFKISQVAVVSLNGVNAAKSRSAVYYSLENGTPISAGITDGSYYSRPAASCFIKTMQNSSDYIEIDLGSEMEVVAVHLYNINDKTSTDQVGTVVGLYTEDYLLAYEQTANTNNRKEVLDFRVITDYKALELMYSNSPIPLPCSTDISWPSFYGTAGIICRFISLVKTPGTGQFGFTKIKAVDKSGRDVAQFKVVTTNSEAATNCRYYGVGDAVAPSPRALSYIATPSDPNPVFLVDLAGEFEICSITIYRCSEDSTLTDNVQLRFHSDATTPFFSLPVTSGQTIFFDTRYDPESSTYPTDIPSATNMSLTNTYGVFGTLALSVDIPLNVSTIQITEGTGQELSKNATITRSSSKTTVTFDNLREVNSVIIDSAPIGTRIILRDCYGYIINNKPIAYVLMNTVAHRLADFRNPAQQSNTNVPLVPLLYDTIRTASTDVKALYTGVVTNGVQMSDGIVARYVKVMPPAGGTLYLSQIIVVDSRGINVAYQKDAFAFNMNIVNTAVKAVDGVYEQTIEMDVSLLSFENYLRKEPSDSFVSSQYWVVDLGAEYLVNSVVYVSANGHGSDSVGAMVELYNAQTNPVAIQAVSKYVKIFGVDILDFRDNRAASAYLPGCYLEVNKRTVEAGPSGCGMMIQYIRIEAADAATPIRLSQLIAINPGGINMALYMPSYSPEDTIGAYKLVDGKYYEKFERPLDGSESEAFVLPAGTGKYIEVNFGNELEIVKVFLLKTKEAANYGNLRIKLYNKFRDIIANLNTAGSTDYTNVTLSIASSSNPFVLPPSRVLGVSIIAKLGEFKNAGGLIPASVLNSPVTTVTPLNQVRVCADSILTVTSRYTRGSSSGIMARYVRVYNINHYVQISQIMVYGDDGTNYAYGAPCKSDSIFPGTYVGKATDGKGGYYHSARPCSESYKSGGKRYDFLQIDLGSMREIIGLRCIFPSDNQGQNIGSRIQLLDESSGQPNLILAQYIVGSNEFQEVRIDFRAQPVAVPISTKIMPKIYSIPGLTTLRSPNGIVETDGNIYIADTLANCIWVKKSPPDTTAATVFWSAAAGQTPYPVGITTDSTYLYVTCYGNNTIMQISISSPANVQTMATSIPIRAPYGICLNGTTLYVTSYVGSSSAIYTVNTATNTTTSNTVAIAYPNSLGFVTINGNQSLLVCSATDKCVWQVNTTSYTVGKYIGAGGTINISLAAPSAISYDTNTSILFISDFVQDYVYSVRLTTGSIERLAGTGTGGYSGDMKQGSLANLDGPMCVYYSVVTGYLYVSDYNNKRLRYIDLYSKAALVIPTTTVIPWTDWTTTTLGSEAVSTMSTSTTYQPVTVTPSTFTQITNPSRISDVKRVEGITAFYIYGSALYYCASGSMYIDGNSSPIVTDLGTITCIAADGGLFYLCDVTNKCVWTVSAIAPYANKTMYIGQASSLVTPTWIGFDRNRRMYISDTDGNCIQRMNKFGEGLEVYVGQLKVGSLSPVTVEMYATDAELSAPHAFVFDSRNNLIFVDSAHEAIYRVMNENGRIQNICNFPSSLAPVYVDSIKAESGLPVPNAQTVKIRDPWGIAIDSANTLYVTSYTGEQIVKMTFNVNALTYSLDVIAGFGADVAGMSGMRNTDPEFGYNITANSYISTIAPLQEVETLAKYASLNHPGHIYYVAGNLYFLDMNSNKIRKITGQTVNTQPVSGILPYGPMNIVANYSKNTYNTTLYTSVFTSIPTCISTFASTCVSTSVSISVSTSVSTSEERSALMAHFDANSVCVDTTGNAYFPNNLTGNILKLDTRGVMSIVTSGLSATVDGIAIYKDIYLFVTDGINVTRVTILDGAKIVAFPLASCSKIAISPVGLLYVASGTSGSGTSIKVYNLKTGATTTTFSLTPTQRSVNSLCVDSDRNIYIGTTNVNVCNIYKYDETYTRIATSPTFPTDPVNNNALPAKSMTISSGKIYYISNNSVYVTDTSMSSLGTIVVGQNNIKGQTVDGSYSNTTTLYNPRGICIDLNGVMYIVDESVPNPMSPQSAGTTVLLKNSTYTPLQTGLLYTVAGTNAPGMITPNLAAYMETFNTIKGICYDSTGRMFVADSALNTISMIDTTGILTTFAGSISTSGSYTGDNAAPIAATLNRPSDIKMSKSDVLYIADTGNNAIRRVKVFDTNYHIETYLSGISSPKALAIDSYENIYVVTANNVISVISPLTETLSTITTRPYTVNALATDSGDRLHYAGNGSIYKVIGAIPDNIVLSGLSTPTGLAIDASNKIYVSDTGNNRVLSANADGTSLTTIVGDGTLEPVFALNSDVAQNIYGNGSPPTTRAFSAPGTLAVNSGRSLLIAQPTKISLLSLGGASGGFVCGNTATSLTIQNGGSGSSPLYLSQIVALNNTGTNVLLKSSAASYFDGFYGCKGSLSAYSIAGGTTLTVPITSADITVVFLYVGTSSKMNWNGATITLGSTTPRTIQGIQEDPSIQYICLDFRNKTPACVPFINYVNKYKLQLTFSPTTEPYRVQYVRYVRIALPSGYSTMNLTRVCVIHAETGVNLLTPGQIPVTTAAFKGIIGYNSIGNIASGTMGGSLVAPTAADAWLEYDLGDEYPIEQVIIYDLTVPKYIVTGYTSNRTLVLNPSSYNTLDNFVKYIRVHGSGYAAPSVSAITYNGTSATVPALTTGTRPYYEYPLGTPSALQTINVVSAAVSPTVPHMLIAYNESYEEVARTGMTSLQTVASSPPSLTIPNPSYLAYSFIPIVGLRRVRYIRLQSLATAPIKISQLIAFDSNRVNVSYRKTATASSNIGTMAGLPVSGSDTTPFTTAAADTAAPYWELDLGQEYDLIQIIYVNNTGVAIDAQIILMDAFRVQRGSSPYTMTTTSYQSFDLRSDSVKHYVALPASVTGSATSLYTPDTSLQGFLRGRYVRIENATPTQPFSVTTPKIYDIYGMNLVNGKVITTPPSTTDYGATWEIDLGQEYSIRDIVYTGTTTAIAVYNRMKAEIWRNFIGAAVTTPFPLQTMPAVATTVTVRFIRIVGASTINHVAAIDSRGVDMAVWKPVRVVSNGSIVSYNTFEGLYSSDITITATAGDRIEIDLGANYKLKSVKVYLSTSPNPTVTLYDTDGTIVNPSPSIVTFAASAGTIQRNSTYGIRARYIALTTLAASASITHLAVVDALGRNLIQTTDKRWSDGHVLLAGTYNEFDLGAEHDVAFVSVYSAKQASPALTLTTLPAFDTTLVGATVRLMDAYYNTRVSRTLEGIGSRYNITYPVGQPWNNTGGYLKNVSIAATTLYTAAGDIVIDVTVNSATNTIYILANNLTTGPSIITVVGGVPTKTLFITTGDLNAAATNRINISVQQPRVWLNEGPELDAAVNQGYRAIGCDYAYYLAVEANNASYRTWGVSAGVPQPDCAPEWNSFYSMCYAKNYTPVPSNASFNNFVNAENARLISYGFDTAGSPFTYDNYAQLCPQSIGYRQIMSDADAAAYHSARGNPWIIYIKSMYTCPSIDTVKSQILAELVSQFTNGRISCSYGYLYLSANNKIRGVTGVTVSATQVAVGSAFVYDTTGIMYILNGTTLNMKLSPSTTPTDITNGLTNISAIAVDKNNMLYVATTNAIYRFSAGTSAAPTLFAGSSTAGFINNDTPTNARFSNIKGMYFDKNNTLFLTDAGNNVIRAITTAGYVTTVTPMSGPTTFTELGSISIDNTNILYFVSGGNLIRLLIQSSFDEPFLAPFTNAIGSVLIPPGATYAEVLNISPPSPPIFTLGSVTNTSFQIIALSADYATGYSYSLNGGALVAITMPLSLPLTISGLTPQSYDTIVVFATNASGSTPSAEQYVQLYPPPVLNVANITTTGFTVSFQILAAATSYTYSLNGGAQVAVSLPASGSTITLPFTGLVEGSNPSIAVTALYTSGITSTPTGINVQLISPAPVLSAATAITSTGFTTSFQLVLGASSYTYTLNGGTPVAITMPASGTTVTLAITGLVASSNPSIYVTAINSSGSSPSALMNLQLAPVKPVLSTPTAITSTGFTTSFQVVPVATSYTYSLNGGADIAVTASPSGSTITLPITGLVAGSNPSITVSAKYTSGSYTVSSAPSDVRNVQLAPAKPVLNAPTNINVNGFYIDFQVVNGATSYTHSYEGPYNSIINAPLAIPTPTTPSTIIPIPNYMWSGGWGSWRRVSVTATNASGSTQSDVKILYTAPESVITFNTTGYVTQATWGQLSNIPLSWTPGEGATAFNIVVDEQWSNAVISSYDNDINTKTNSLICRFSLSSYSVQPYITFTSATTANIIGLAGNGGGTKQYNITIYSINADGSARTAGPTLYVNV